MVEDTFRVSEKLRQRQRAGRQPGSGLREKNAIDSPRIPPLLSAPMKTALILVVGLRMGKAV
jgi:hypothetical protein